MKIGKKLLAGVLALAMVVSSLFTWQGGITVQAADIPPEALFTGNSISLTGNCENDESRGSGESYDGYIQTFQDADILASDYLKIEYTASGDIIDETEVFNLQPFDTSWGGWDDNIITIGDSVDNGDGTYTAYIPTQKVVQSLSSGGTLNGINISFAAEGVDAVLTAMTYMVEKDFTETSMSLPTDGSLDSSNDAHYSDGAWNGYIATFQDTGLLESDYIKIDYTAGDGVTGETVVFTLQPFDTSWGGWDDNIITIGDSVDNGDGTYTAYIATQKIIQSLNGGAGGNIKGINISFYAEDVEATLAAMTYMAEGSSSDDGDNEDSHQLDEAKYILDITGDDLVAAGIDAQSLIDNDCTATFYIHITQADNYSYIHARTGGTGGGSNKYLIGEDCTKQKSSIYWIQNSENNDGVGSAGTANYKFPANSISSSKINSVSDFSLSIRIYTTNTEAEPLGIIFSDGQSVAINVDADGDVTLTEGFTEPVCESTTLEDPTAIKDVWQQTVEMRRDNLKLSLDYIAEMDSSRYTADSWQALQEAVVVATAEYENPDATTDSLKTARDTLENVKAKLIFVTETDDSNALPFRELSAQETVAEMGAGINLGNTMDGHSGFTPSETAWQSAVTTKEYIKALHDAGYNTVRIPVTWGNMIDDENGYAINETWLNRVQDIVDYCVEQDMYAIINVHHDGAEQTGWLRVAADDIDSVMEKYEAVWRHIAERFKDYDEHLIFESMNEISCSETDKNGSEAVAYDTPIIVNFNQLFVNTVRSTGSNNTKRWLAVVAHYANNGSSSSFTLPEDTYNDTNRLMFAAHIYVASTNTTWKLSDIQGLWERLQAMQNKFGSDVPMYLGEYGNRIYEQSGTESGYNDVARAWFCEIANRACQVAGVVPIVWDQGFGTNGEYETGLFSYWNRTELRPIFKTIIDGMMRGTYLAASDLNLNYDFSDIEQDPEVVEITSITPSATTVDMTIGDWETLTVDTAPAETNDIVFWSTDNDDIVTVFNGKLHAKGIGQTTVHVYSQSGSVSEDIVVNVSAKASSEDVTITVDEDTKTIILDKSTTITASASNGEAVTFTSSNPDVATVNSLGKVVGTGVGRTYIIVTSESGATKTVEINVKDALDTDEISLGLKVLYNDSVNEYWSTETGTVINVTGDGQYTVRFDCDTDLSNAAKNAGITNLDRLTSIYIKDQSVDTGETKASPVETCMIQIDKVVLDGQELTLNSNAEAKEAIKSGVFDSGNPVNAWDGSAVDEVSVSDHVATFTTNTEHKVIEITFTLSGMKFKTSSSEIQNPAEKMEAEDGETINICPDTMENTFEVSVKLTPANTENVVTFVSSDESVISVPSKAVSVDENGYATVTATIVGDGNATITAMTDNGLTTVFEIKREHDYKEVSRVDAQVGVDGVINYECQTCGKTMSEIIPAIDADNPEITLGIECRPIDGVTPSATITDKDFPSTEGVKNVIVEVTIPDSAADTWNDWCGNIVRVTDKDGVHYYMWGGAQVGWNKDFDGDDVDDIIGGVDGEQWVGTVVDGKATLVIPVSGDEFTIDFITDCYVDGGAPTYDGVLYVIEKASLSKEENPSIDPGDDPSTNPDDSDDDPTEGPVDTGDTGALGFMLIALAASAATGVVTIKKRRRA